MKKVLFIHLIIGSLLMGSTSVHAEVTVTTKNKIESTDELLPFHHSRPRKADITHTVIHFISDVSRNPTNPFTFQDIHSVYKEYGVSAHYMIDRDGEIYRLVPENRVAYHAGKGYAHGFPKYKDNLNEVSVGIELMAVGTEQEMDALLPKGTYSKIHSSSIGYTDAQYESLNQILDNLYEKYPSIVRNRWHVIGHDEYAPGRKTDPGSLFDWGRIGY
ncbi:N-acetylmuramoyl-L-alanine amidase [Bacillus suaedaesalsae]|uniref:N-acetylmuramoyl-L-alanine amidase n=1 Tax=Bacillus suaedaesalsae TaxID=2810349 RepID=A0ABS2DKR9_9BACI|nr:N-acetylmuramoyl-L-alanine amidase [Bacillus suaedaesalsae]MBM6619002.1 N-acetylmuramoyl-L-alanine amidase [Bacillus suaedaesalsae]